MSTLAMLPVHRIATVGTDPAKPVQVIGLWEAGDMVETGDLWLCINEDGTPEFYRFSEIKFDGWLP